MTIPIKIALLTYTYLLITAYTALIRSVQLYYCTVWDSSASVEHRRSLEAIQKHSMAIIFPTMPQQLPNRVWLPCVTSDETVELFYKTITTKNSTLHDIPNSHRAPPITNNLKNQRTFHFQTL